MSNSADRILGDDCHVLTSGPERAIFGSMSGPNQLSESDLVLVDRLAREWDLSPSLLEAELLAAPDEEEFHRRFELLLEIESRSSELECAFGQLNAARECWANGIPDGERVTFKQMLSLPHSMCLLDEVDDVLWTMVEMFEGLSRPGVPIEDSFKSLVIDVFGNPPKNLGGR